MFSTRIEGYVKIRGVRVSLPEIEDVFRQHSAIKDVVVVDYTTQDIGEKSLGAICLVDNGSMPGADELRAFAQGYLPCNHIPGRFIAREAFPLTTNGKVDRHALRAELAQAHLQTLPPVELTTCITSQSTERKILEIYCAAMNQPMRPEWNPGVPFIAMGLKLSHLPVIRENLNAEFNRNLSGQDLIKCKNVSDVCALLT